MTGRVYLDHNATAPAWPEVVAAVSAAMGQAGNASSVHASGRAARTLVEEARRRVAALAGADPDGVIFTGSATEANNQALRCVRRPRALVSAVEHESVLRARPGAVVIPVCPDGRVDLAALDAILATDTEPAILALMLANNETGVIQPVAEAARLARGHGALVHCDAVQAAGKVPFDMAAIGADLVSLSAHKIGGPQGVGALVARDVSLVERLIRGGGQERGLRAGTENVAGIVGFGVAAELARAALPAFSRLAGLRDLLERRLREIDPSVAVFGAGAARLPNTSQIATPGIPAETQVIAFDLAGIAVSAGSACSAGKIETPHVLTAMGVDERLARCAIRVSLGRDSTEADVAAFVAAWRALRDRLPRSSAAA